MEAIEIPSRIEYNVISIDHFKSGKFMEPGRITKESEFTQDQAKVSIGNSMLRNLTYFYTPPQPPTDVKQEIKSAIQDEVNRHLARQTTLSIIGDLTANLNTLSTHLNAKDKTEFKTLFNKVLDNL